MKTMSRAAAAAALIQAAANLWILVLLLALLPRLGARLTELGDPNKAAHVESQPLYWVSAASVDLITGIAFVVIALALYGLLRRDTVVRVGTVLGVLAGVAWVVGAVLQLTAGSHLASLYSSDPASAAAAFSSTTGPEEVAVNVARALSAIWLALVFWTALRQRALPAPLDYLALAVALIGLVSVVVAPARLLLAVGMIVFAVWFAAVILRGPRTEGSASASLHSA